MKWIVPVAKNSGCPPTQEHWDRVQVEFDEVGVVRTICPEHGPVMGIESMEFDSEAEARAYVDSRKGCYET